MMKWWCCSVVIFLLNRCQWPKWIHNWRIEKIKNIPVQKEKYRIFLPKKVVYSDKCAVIWFNCRRSFPTCFLTFASPPFSIPHFFTLLNFSTIYMSNQEWDKNLISQPGAPNRLRITPKKSLIHLRQKINFFIRGYFNTKNIRKQFHGLCRKTDSAGGKGLDKV